MTEVYRTGPIAAPPTDSQVMVVHCSDPRYQPHFQDFLRHGLSIRRYGLVAIPGGAQTLTLVEYLPKFAWSGWRWLKFMVNLMRPDRVVLISHDDCRWYVENRFASEAGAREKQVQDLRRVRDALVERFGAIRVDLYHAVLEGEHARFDSL